MKNLELWWYRQISNFYTARMVSATPVVLPFGNGEHITNFTVEYEWKYGKIIAKYSMNMFVSTGVYAEHYAKLIKNKSRISIKEIKNLGKTDKFTYWDYTVKFES